MRYAISGSNGFIGKTLGARFKSFENLGREGFVPKVDVVFDLAAYGNLASQPKDEKKIYEANLIRIIKSFNHLNKKTKFIYISTSSVTLSQQTAYSLSKKATEDYLRFKAQEGYKVAIIRPYTVIGP